MKGTSALHTKLTTNPTFDCGGFMQSKSSKNA